MPIPKNPQLLLIVGETRTGKSSSLMGLRDQPSWYYANHEPNRSLPFKDSFKKAVIVDPLAVIGAFNTLVADPNSTGLIIDSVTFMMEQYEKMYVSPMKDGREGWKNYHAFFTDLLQVHVPQCKRHVICLAHTTDSLDSYNNIVRKIPIKGQLKEKGVESYFQNVIATKKMRVTELDKPEYQNPLLAITDRERRVGFKHVFQTQVTAETVAERISCPMLMWDENETFIDNNVQYVIDRLEQHYA